MGKKATGQKKAYYERQKAVTARHKAARLQKRKKRLEYWIAKGVKKNGEKVLSLDERKARAQARKQVRDEKRAADRKKFRQMEQDWINKNPGKNPGLTAVNSNHLTTNESVPSKIPWRP